MIAVVRDLGLFGAGALFMNVLEHYIYVRSWRQHHQQQQVERRVRY